MYQLPKVITICHFLSLLVSRTEDDMPPTYPNTMNQNWRYFKDFLWKNAISCCSIASHLKKQRDWIMPHGKPGYSKNQQYSSVPSRKCFVP